MLRPSIYIGLGGTGVKAIAQAKKMFEDDYGVGNIPPEIAFLAVDFDNAVVDDTTLATKINEDFILLKAALNPYDQFCIRNQQYGEYKWMFPGNTSYIANRIQNGASQVRTTGRLYTEIVLPQFKAAFNSAMARVTSIMNTNSRGAQCIDVHIVCSLAGGSGAGAFLTIAESIYIDYIKDNAASAVKLYGYGVLHSVFEAMDPAGNLTPRVFSNAYSAIMDIDYLMHATYDDPVQVIIDEKKHVLNRHLFNEFYVIDNCTQSGQSVKTVKDLSEVVGTCLFVSGSDVGDAKETIASNVDWTKGEGNVDNKKGWVYGLGACSVVYKGEVLSKLYGIKAAIELIRRMRQEDADIYGKALTWTEEVGIREDNINEGNVAHDMLIEAIYSSANISRISECPVDYKDSDANLRTTINDYLNKYVNFPSEKDLAARADDLKKKLNERVADMLKADNGVGNANVFVGELKNLCENFRDEMSNEQQRFELRITESQENLLNRSLKDYDAERSKLKYKFKGANDRQVMIEDYLGIPATEILRLKHEAKRREAAYGIFISLLAEIDVLLEKISLLDRKLLNLRESYSKEYTDESTNVQTALVFEYDLSADDRRNMKLISSEILVDEFIASLPQSLLDIDVNSELKECIDTYARSLPKAKEFKEKRIIDVVNELSDEKYEEMKSRILVLSGTLLSYDNKGQRTLDGRNVTDALKWGYMISLNAQTNEKTRFENDSTFLRHSTVVPQYIKSDNVNKQKIIFYRSEAAILPYCLTAFGDFKVETKYNSVVRLARNGAATFNPHYDRLIFEKMRETDFKLKPEMKNEALFYWVCGQIFGWETIIEDVREMNFDEKGNAISEGRKKPGEHQKYVCCLRKKYMYWDIELPAGKDKQWQPLGNTGRRDTAFNYFKTEILPEHKENFKALIRGKYEESKSGWRMKIQECANYSLTEYIDLLVCADKNSLTFASNNNAEYKLLQEEHQYLRNNLLNALDCLK